MKEYSSIENIVGKVSSEDKAEILDTVRRHFKDQDFKDVREKEKEKTPEELIIIDLVNDATNEIRKKYGLKKFDIPSNNIHIMKNWPAKSPEISGWFEQGAQRIILKEKPQRIAFMKNLFHEMLHFKSYNALQVANVADSLVLPYRSGLSICKRDFSAGYLEKINEAVVEELTKRFSKELTDNPVFAKETKRTRRALEAHSTDIHGDPLPENRYEDVFYAEDSKFGLFELTYSYQEERDILKILIDKLFERNNNMFSNKEEVFEMFAKGFMTGNILPIGKLIDKTFGTGTLRNIGKLRELKEFIDSL